MRLTLTLTLTLAASLLGSAALAAPPAIDPPQRMPGLWMINTAPAESAASVPGFHLCIGSGEDDVLLRPGNPFAHCSEQRWTRDAYYTYYSASCTADGRSSRVEGRFGGDFMYNFQGELTVTPEPATAGSSATRLAIDGRRLGPCKAGQAPGKFLIRGRDGVGNLNVGEPVRPR